MTSRCPVVPWLPLWWQTSDHSAVLGLVQLDFLHSADNLLCDHGYVTSPLWTPGWLDPWSSSKNVFIRPNSGWNFALFCSTFRLLGLIGCPIFSRESWISRVSMELIRLLVYLSHWGGDIAFHLLPWSPAPVWFIHGASLFLRWLALLLEVSLRWAYISLLAVNSLVCFPLQPEQGHCLISHLLCAKCFMYFI